MFLVEYWSPICVLDGSSLKTNSNCATPENWWQRARFGFFGGAKDSFFRELFEGFPGPNAFFLHAATGGVRDVGINLFFLFFVQHLWI